MEIMQTKEYNRRQNIRYDEAVAKWMKENNGNIIPQVAFYHFWTRTGNLRENGYVAINGRSHFWARTKKEVIKLAERG